MSKKSFLPKMGCWMEGYGPYCEVANFDSFGYDGEGVGSINSTPNEGPGYASHVVCMQDRTNRCLEQFNDCIADEIELSAKDLYPNHTALELPGSDVSSKAYALSHYYRTRMGRELYFGFGPGPFIKGPRLISRLNPLDPAYKRLEYNPNFEDNKNHAVSDTLHVLHNAAKRNCYKEMSTWVNCDYTSCFCPIKKCVRCEDDLEITFGNGVKSNTTSDPSVSSGKSIRRHNASVSVTESTYNKMIPIIVGTGVVGGNVIEVGQGRVELVTIETDTTVEEVQIPVTSFAVSVSADEMRHLLRIWVNDKLVYNKARVDSDPSLNTTLYQDLSKYGLGDYKISFTPRVEFFPGETGQNPFRALDTTRAPVGYRDQAVIVFRDWAFGTSTLPKIRVEVSSEELDFGTVTESASLSAIVQDPAQLPSGDIAVATTSGIYLLNNALETVKFVPSASVLRFGVTESNDVFFTTSAASNTLNITSALSETILSYVMSVSPQNVISVRGKNKQGAPITVFFAVTGASVEVIQFDGTAFLSAGVVTLGASVVDAFAFNGNKSFALFVGSGLMTRINVTNEQFDFDPFNMDIAEFPYAQSVRVARVVSEGLMLIGTEGTWINYVGRQTFPGVPVPEASNAKFSGTASYLSEGKSIALSVAARNILVDYTTLALPVQGTRAIYETGRQSYLSVLGQQLVYSQDRGVPVPVFLPEVIGELNTRLLGEYETVTAAGSDISVYGLVLTSEAGLRDLYANISTVFNYRWENGLNAQYALGTTQIDLYSEVAVSKTYYDKVSAVTLEFIDQDVVKSVRTAASINGTGKLMDISLPLNMSTTQARVLAEFTGQRMQARTNLTGTLSTNAAHLGVVPGDEIVHQGTRWRVETITDDLPKRLMTLVGSDYTDALVSLSPNFIPNANIADQTSNSGIEIVNVPLIDDSAGANTSNFYAVSSGATGFVEYSFPSVTAARKISSRSLSGKALAGKLSMLPPEMLRLAHVQPSGSFSVLFETTVTLASFNIPATRDWGTKTLVVGREIIRYTDVAISVDGLTATFSNLIRGLRNTDVFAHTHALDERVIVYDETKFVPIVGPRGPNGTPRRVKLRVQGKVSSINIQRRLATDYTLPPLLLRRDDTSSGEPWLMALPRFWNARFIQNPNSGLVMQGSPDVNNFQMISRQQHTFGDPGIVNALFILEAPFDRETFLSNFSLSPNSYIRRHLLVGGVTKALYRGGTTQRNARDNVPGWWVSFGVDADNPLARPTEGILAYGQFPLDTVMRSIPVRATEYNMVGRDANGETSLHSRLFGFNHIAPHGFSLPNG